MFEFLDHIIWIAKDLESGKADIQKLMGTMPVDGGIHKGQGTRNALLGLGQNCYLEILSPDPKQPQPGHWSDAILKAKSDGLFHWAARHPNLSALHQKALNLGLESSGVLPFSRQSPTGETFEWRLLFLGGHEYGALVPFFIDWGNTPHPSQNIPAAGGIMRFTIVSPQAEQLQKLMYNLGIEMDVFKGGNSQILVEIGTKDSSITLPCLQPMGMGAQAPQNVEKEIKASP